MLPRRYPLRIRRTSLIERVQDRQLYEAASRSRGGTRALEESLLEPPIHRPAERLLDRRVPQAEVAGRLRAVVGVTADQRPSELAADTRAAAAGDRESGGW